MTSRDKFHAKDSADTPPAGPGRRAPRKPTRKSLENAALAYLGRFAATARGLEQVLMRRVQRAARAGVADAEDGAALVRAVVARYREAGLIDDAAFARARAETLFARGLSLKAIRRRLALKGVGAAEIATALDALATDHGASDGPSALDRAAAVAFARRRRLGPWRAAATRRDRRERDMAALARAGFSYSIARAVIDGESDDVTDA